MTLTIHRQRTDTSRQLTTDKSSTDPLRLVDERTKTRRANCTLFLIGSRCIRGGPTVAADRAVRGGPAVAADLTITMPVEPGR